MNYKVKLICGFRKDQEHTIDADEAHKAYYLYLHPDTRTVFKNGLAIKGEQIQKIVPDYHETMGWNQSHTIDSDDWNEIHKLGVHTKLTNMLSLASQIAQTATPEQINTPLTQLLEQTPKNPHVLAGKHQLLEKMRM